MKRTAELRRHTRGRSGGRAGGSGYDYQDLYVALHLAELLMGARDPLVEVLWEKKALDPGDPTGRAEAVHVDDLILARQSGSWTYVQLKETAPRGGWSVRKFVQSGIADQFWRQWTTRPLEQRNRVTVLLATNGDVASLRDLIDVAQRARTPAELVSEEGAALTAPSVALIADALSLPATSIELLSYLKAIDVVQLPSAVDLDAWITQRLVAFGEKAPAITDRLVRLIAESKHSGASARSSYTRQTLIDRLLKDGLAADDLISAGVVRAAPVTSAAAWVSHRAEIVKQFRRFRLYGLNIAKPVYADLLTLFVAPLLARAGRGEDAGKYQRRDLDDRPTLADRVLREGRDDDFHWERGRPGVVELAAALNEHGRIGFVAGPGTGKTTTLKWLALVSALDDDEGRQCRIDIGLPPEPLIPLYVSFRQFARRVRARELGGVQGRVGLVSDFIAAQLESGLAGAPSSREKALQIAQSLLESDRTLLLFDGLDEVSDDTMRDTLFTAVTDLIETYKAPRVIIASRPAGIRRFRPHANLALFEPLPLGRERRALFARQWYRAVRVEGDTFLTETEIASKSADLARDAEALVDLTSNPLLLSILALIHFNRGGLPVDRATLYDHATVAMLGHWERDVAGRDLGDDAIPRDWAQVLQLNADQIRLVVERLAWRLHEKGVAEVSTEAVEETLAHAFKELARRASHPPSDRAAVMVRLLVDRSGLLLERDPGVLSFAHLSFRDYLAACDRVRSDEAGLRQLVAFSSDDAHDELLRFALGIIYLEKADGVERARTLLSHLGEVAPTLAVSCLLDAPDIAMDGATINRLAHGVWIEADRGHHRPGVAARLLRVLFLRSADPDRLLVALLARGEHDRHRMGSDLAFRLLLERPDGPLAPELAWLLRRVAVLPQATHRHREPFAPFSVQGVARLLLAEAGSGSPADNVEALATLLGRHHWAGDASDDERTADKRAKHVLLNALRSGDGASVGARLESLLTTKGSGFDRTAVARLMMEARAPATPLVIDVLVNALDEAPERDAVSEGLSTWMADPGSDSVVRYGLEKGFHNGNQAVRRACARLLGRVDLPLPPEASRSGNDEEEKQRVGEILRLLDDAGTQGEALTLLEDELWDENLPVAWQAALALATAGRFETPGLAHALVRVGFAWDLRQRIAVQYVRQMLRDPRSARATRAAILESLESSHSGTAATSAFLLLETEGVDLGTNLPHILQAALRETARLDDTIPHLQRLLRSDNAEETAAVLTSYLSSTTNLDSAVAGRLAILLADEGASGSWTLARELVLHGAGTESTRPQANVHLRTMLDDHSVSSEVRRALSEGLKSSDSRVAWNAARLLCERESFFEEHLPDVLVRAGLGHHERTERTAAHQWLCKMLARPRLAKRTRKALQDGIEDALNRGRQYGKNYELAWEAASCLVSATVMEADNLPEAVIVGGFAELTRHEHVMALLRKLCAAKPELAADIEETLRESLRAEDTTVRWGAATAILEIFPETVSESARLVIERREHRHDESDDDEDASKKSEAFLASLTRVLLQQSRENAAAHRHLERLLASTDDGPAIRLGLITLLEQKDRDDADCDAVALGAAECLVKIDRYETKHIATAVVKGPLGRDPLHVDAARLLDTLRANPSTAGLVADALGTALWSDDGRVAGAAAEYLVRRGESDFPGVARGLVRARADHHRRRWDPEAHVQAFLRDSRMRQSVLDALGAAVFDDDEETSYDTARLLLGAGGRLSDRILDVLDRKARVDAPLGPLALLATTGQVDNARRLAEGRGMRDLVAVLGRESV
ncbi:MAG: NACHT domain-containing protein [Deltaproteobacteria bacterium]|nr:NACHT domain-containing protein [Deltaproteobacteria bacterium]MBI3390994.1 NACHT domain-containing protein [Deltaproteobacteria bacterium]